MPDTPASPGSDEVAKLLADAPGAESGSVDQASIDALLNQAQSALSSIDEPAAPLPEGVTTFEFKDLSGTQAANETASLDLLRDVQLDLKIELGRTQMHLEDVLRLKQGAVVTLDKLAGDPVDVYANGRLIARGEVLVLNDNFCVRVAELIAGDDAAA
jgi:flagellar motor switch protein FliN/FliY